MIFIQGMRNGKTIEYLLQYITNYIEETKSNDFWEFNLNGRDFDNILINNISINDELFFKMLKERIIEIIGANINIEWSENIIERGKTLTIKREEDEYIPTIQLPIAIKEKNEQFEREYLGEWGKYND